MTRPAGTGPISVTPMRRAIGAVGRVLVTTGILILLFVAYQLWGTGIYEARQQQELKDQFAGQIATTTTTTTAPGPTSTTVPPPPPPAGEAIAILQIPRIGVDSAVVQGTGRADLRKGPGHYPLTPLPGQLGNAAIAGHRTTYGAPFNRLDELAKGDPIVVRTLAGTYHYTVTEQLIVKPKDVFVLDATPDPKHPGRSFATLTLTTCNPEFSARQRLVVHAVLDAKRSPKPQKAAPVAVKATLDEGLSGRSGSKLPTLWWALIVALVGGLWWLVFHRYHRWTTWLMGAIPFGVALFFFYFHLERLLPGNY